MGVSCQLVLRRCRVAILVLMALVFPAMAAFAEEAQALFAAARPSIFQVRIMEASSGEKASIGSGFQISNDGLIATNFHVISEVVHQPDKYRLEFVAFGGATGPLQIVDFDVVHDLALVRRASGEPSPHLNLSTSHLANGQPLFAVGNPLDLGQSIVPGAYNGLVETSFYQKLLFTGSLNPGMSGGPTLNRDGLVIGVNVSTAGNQISFLVPVEHLARLVEGVGEGLAAADYESRIEAQLIRDQESKFNQLLDGEWQTQRLGKSVVASAPEAFFKCWGDTSDDKDQRFITTDASCMSLDDIYVSNSFSTGTIEYQFLTIKSDELTSLQFNRLYGNLFGSMYTRNRARKKHVTNFHCSQGFVTPKTQSAESTPDGLWRNVFCARQYKDYRGLYDVLFLATFLGGDREGLSAHFALSGVSKDNANRFVRRFIEVNAWRS